MKHLYYIPLLLGFFVSRAQITILQNFNDTNGGYPSGSLIYDGTYLYGVTSSGGSDQSCNDGCGTVYKIKPDGTGFTKLLDFGAGISGPGGSLYFDGTYLYGATAYGGGGGAVFKIRPDGTGYTDPYYFYSPTGYFPNGSFVSDGTYLFGTTYEGGPLDEGTIFKIKQDGSSFDTLMSFNSTNGAYSEGYLYYDGIYLYGVAVAGGAHDHGVIFKILPDGSGFQDFFDFSENQISGGAPLGALISDGTFLYGTTQSGGTYDFGTVYKIKPDGTQFSTLINFNDTNGWGPSGALYYDGTFLYGATGFGGGYNDGTIFKLKTDGSGFVKMVDLNNATGWGVVPPLISDGTYLYGAMSQSLSGGYGAIFKISKTTVAGVPEVDNGSFIQIYPNPASTELKIKSGKIGELIRVEITDVFGNVVITADLDFGPGITINLDSLKSGIYFVKTPYGTQHFIKL